MSKLTRFISYRSIQRTVFVFVIVAALVVALLPTAAFASSRGGRWHVVQAGDNLSTIASANGLSLWAVMQANGIANPNYIYAGQLLWIPDNGYYSGGYHPGGYHPGHTPMPGPGHYPAGGQYYRVQPGDTLSQIAVTYGVNMWHLASINGIANPNYIRSGMMLRLW